tara:strand:- start:2835 stop:4028 length:1194 start_codon:yes stop_codon:yes gene_type:complete
MSKNYNIFFDLGSTTIRGAAFGKNFNDQQISFEKKCNLSLKKENLNIDNLNDNLEFLILDLEKKTNEYIENANILIDSVDSLNLIMSISKKGDNKKLTSNDAKILVQSAKQDIVRHNRDIEILHIIITNFKIDGENFSTLPIEKKYKLLSIDILFICFPKNILNKINHIFKKNNILAQNFISSSYSKTFNYKDKFTSLDNIMFIELGYDKTSIITYKNQYLKTFNIIPIGGNHITKDISKILKLSYEESENIKKGFNDKDLFSENSSIQKELLRNLDQNNLTHQEFSIIIKEIIFARSDEILSMSTNIINDVLTNKNGEKYKIILIGSGSRIFESNSISIAKNPNLLDEFDYFTETAETICKSGENLLLQGNSQEVIVVPKQKEISGFFVRFFNFFK